MQPVVFCWRIPVTESATGNISNFLERFMDGGACSDMLKTGPFGVSGFGLKNKFLFVCRIYYKGRYEFSQKKLQKTSNIPGLS
jgi:hypothetical protein